MSHEIFLKYFYWISFFWSTHGFDIESYDVLYFILCKLYIFRICVLDWHIHCLIWNYKNCCAQPWLSFGILQELRWSWECISYFFFTDTGFCSEILKYALFLFLGLVDDTPWMKNKHQISLRFRPEKNGQHFADNIFKWIFLSKNTLCLSVCLSVFLSVCLCLSHIFHYVPIIVSSWNFQEWLPMTGVMSMQKFKVRGQKSRLQISKPKLAVSGP